MKKLICIVFTVLMIFIQSAPVLAEVTTYDFSDEAQAEFDRQEAQERVKLQNQNAQPINADPKIEKTKRKNMSNQTYSHQEVYQPSPRTVSGTVLVVPSGVSFEAILQSAISSESLAENDVIAAVLSSDWYYNGTLIAPQGSVLYGKATDVKKAGYAYANGKLAMTFDEILTPSGDRIRLTSNKVYVEIKDKRIAKIAGNVLIGAIGGVVTGALYSLISGGDIVGGLAVGSAVGAAGGMVTAVAHKGEGAEVPAGTAIIVKIVQPIEVVPYN